MPKPYQRSSSLRKLKRRTTTGLRVLYKRRKKGKKHHDMFGDVLHGVKNDGTKTQNRPSRIYGGTLSHRNLENVLRYAARVKEGSLRIDDIPIRYRELVNRLVERI